MKQKIIGIYYAGYEQIQLVLREGDGGEFYVNPEEGSIPRIKVGADYLEWYKLLGVLQHEVMEFLLFKKGCRLLDSSKTGSDSGQFLFLFDHTMFSEIKDNEAEFLSEAIPDLKKAWKKFRKKRKK